MYEQLKTKRQSFSDLLTLTFEFMKMHFMEILPYTLGIGAVLGLVQGIVGWFEANAQLNNIKNAKSFAELAAATGGTAIFSLLISILIAYAGLVVFAGVTKLILERLKGNAFTFMDVFNYLKSAGMPLFLTSIVVGLALSGLFILLIVPSIYFGVKWTFYSLVAVDQGKYYFKATDVSSTIVNGRWLQAAGYLLAVSLIIGIPTAIIGGIVAGIFGAGVTVSYTATTISPIGYILSSVVSNTISFGFMTAIQGVFVTLMYVNWTHFAAEAPTAYVPAPMIPTATPMPTPAPVQPVTEAVVVPVAQPMQAATPTEPTSM